MVVLLAYDLCNLLDYLALYMPSPQHFRNIDGEEERRQQQSFDGCDR
jgi:hypothetical protein